MLVVGNLAARFAAEMRSLDSGTALRYAGWGAGAALAVIAAVLASRADFAQRRAERPSLADAADSAGMAARQERENRRLAAAVRDLSEDRERLAMRMAALERSLLALSESTGSTGPIDGRTELRAMTERPRIYPPVELPVIATPPAGMPAQSGAAQASPLAPNIAPPPPAAKPTNARTTPVAAQSSAAPASAAPVSVAPVPVAPAARQPISTSQPPPQVTPPPSAPPQANIAAGPAETNRAPNVVAAIAPGRPTPTAASAGERSTKGNAVAREPEAPPMPLRPPEKVSDRVLPEDQPTASVPVAAPARPSAVPAAPPPAAAFAAIAPPASTSPPPSRPPTSETRESARGKASEKAAESVAIRTDFGVDVGGGATPTALREAWASLKANQGPLLGSLRPVMVVRESAKGLELRLVAGPLPNAAQAARLCAALASAGRTCTPAVFEGQRLAAQ